ncbi:MAG: energy-coupling factor ABC transporter ATP-binding protein [Candidatus Hodarchaeota archaeon]
MVITISKDFPLIIIENVEYTYPNGTIALKDINLNVYKGELLGIMGKNGAGKTTLIRTLNGLIRPTSGNIYINNKNIGSKSIAELSKKVGLIFQNPSHQLFANTVEDEIEFSLKNLNMNKEELELKTNEILKNFNLDKYRDRSPLNLSGGESKKLAIASIICRGPEILVFDEPTLGQDAREIESFIRLINNEKKQGKTIIIITHNIEFAYEFIPRTILMEGGEIIADGPTHNVLSNGFLTERSSLILPQTRQLSLVLQEIGFQGINKYFSKSEITEYLIKFLRKKTTSV